MKILMERKFDPDRDFYVPTWVAELLVGSDPPNFHVVATTPTHITLAWAQATVVEKAIMRTKGEIRPDGWKIPRELLPKAADPTVGPRFTLLEID